MKNFLLVIIAISLIVSMAACGNSSADSASQPADTSSSAAEESSEAAVEESSEEAVEEEIDSDLAESTDGTITYTDMAGYERNDQLAASMGIDGAIAAYMKLSTDSAALVVVYPDDEYKEILEDPDYVSLMQDVFSSMMGFSPDIEEITIGDYEVVNLSGNVDFEGTEMAMVMNFVKIGDHVYIVQGQSDSAMGSEMNTAIETFIGNIRANAA